MKSILFSVDQREDLVENVITEFVLQCEKYNTDSVIEKGKMNIKKFSDGEIIVDFKDSVRGARVYLMASPNTSDKIMSLILAIDAVKRASAKEIIVILPYFPYARQDKKDVARGPIGAKVMANMLEDTGADAIVTFELHADQIQGFFEIPLTHIEGRYLFASHIAEIVAENADTCAQWVLCAPDAGASKRVKALRDLLRDKFNIPMSYVLIDKTRKEANIVDEMELIGDVRGKNVIIADDMVDTAGTLCKAANLIMDEGAVSVMALATHGVLSGNAMKNIGASRLSKLIVSDSLIFNCCNKDYDMIEKLGEDKIEIVSVAKQVAKALISVNNNYSIEDLKSTI